jgi:VCBS repeat-containing protein
MPNKLPTALAATIIYVKPGGSTSAGCGSTWANACELQTALATASAGEEIWVAAGTYKPGTNREDTFQLISGVALYGGFAGTETASEQRNWGTNPTVLSGDIGITDDDSDNSYHVVTGTGADATAILDGFIIKKGNANSAVWPNYCGGGMFNDTGSPSVVNVTFNDNTASDYGGGIYNYFSSLTLTNVTFTNNQSGQFGGGLHNYEGNLSLTNVIFKGNIAIDSGGGLYNANTEGNSTSLMNVEFIGNLTIGRGGGMANMDSSSTLTNVTFSGNKASYGGGLYNSYRQSPTIVNVILWGNTADKSGPQIYNNESSAPYIQHSNIEGGCSAIPGNDCSGGGNIDGDPLFTRNPHPGPDGAWGSADDDYGDLRPMSGSPVIDAGDNTAPGLAVITTDLGGNPRFYNVPEIPDSGVGPPPVIDMGAYEKQANDAPAAGDDNYITDQNVPLQLNAPGILVNDDDPDGDSLNPVLENGPSSGNLNLNADGSFDYSPEANFTGVVTFTYHASDGLLLSNTATVTIKVSGVNDAPIAFNDVYITPEDALLSVNTPGVLKNDNDPDDDPLSAVLDSGPSKGSLILNPDGSFYYLPESTSGIITFTYHATDGSKNSNTATVTITISSINEAPVAVNDTYTTTVNATLSINTPGVLTNDSDPDGNPLSVLLESEPSSGSLALNPDGSFDYQPEKDYNGMVTFTYHATDGELNSNTATVTITVTNRSDVYLPLINRYVVGSCPPLYQDDFSNPGSSWPHYEDENVIYDYLNGEYQITAKNPSWWVGARPGYQAADYTVEVDVRKFSDGYGSYGILFGLADDWSQFYSFEIDPQGYYSIFLYDNGDWSTLGEGFSPAINQGSATNHLKIVRNGKLIEAWANGNLLSSISNNAYTGQRYVGLIASTYDVGNLDIRYDNFLLKPLTCGSGILKSDENLSLEKNWERGKRFIRSPINLIEK